MFLSLYIWTLLLKPHLAGRARVQIDEGWLAVFFEQFIEVCSFAPRSCKIDEKAPGVYNYMALRSLRCTTSYGALLGGRIWEQMKPSWNSQEGHGLAMVLSDGQGRSFSIFSAPRDRVSTWRDDHWEAYKLFFRVRPWNIRESSWRFPSCFDSIPFMHACMILYAIQFIYAFLCFSFPCCFQGCFHCDIPSTGWVDRRRAFRKS